MIHQRKSFPRVSPIDSLDKYWNDDVHSGSLNSIHVFSSSTRSSSFVHFTNNLLTLDRMIMTTTMVTMTWLLFSSSPLQLQLVLQFFGVPMSFFCCTSNNNNNTTSEDSVVNTKTTAVAAAGRGEEGGKWIKRGTVLGVAMGTGRVPQLNWLRPISVVCLLSCFTVYGSWWWRWYFRRSITTHTHTTRRERRVVCLYGLFLVSKS